MSGGGSEPGGDAGDPSGRGAMSVEAIPSPELLEAFPQAAVVTDLQGTIVAWNSAAHKLYGYSREDALGHPSRELLPSPDTVEAAERIWGQLGSGEPWTGDFPVRRSDGSPFVAFVQLILLRSDKGATVGVLGLSEDVTADRQRRLELEVATVRLEVLAELSIALSSSLDLDVVLHRLAELLVPHLADICVVDLRDESVGERTAAVAARATSDKDLFEEAERRLPRRRNPTSSLSRTMRSGEPTLVPDCSDAYLSANTPDPATADLYMSLGITSIMCVPLTARERILGAVTFLRTRAGGESPPYNADDVEQAAEIARHAAIAVDNARLYTGEHRVAETLQRRLLPEISPGEHLSAAARYMPASAGVGGDWYDLFEVPGGVTAVAIGDVMGHDITAAASMGQLRSVLRAYACEGSNPADVLDKADRLVQNFEMAQLTTAFFGRLSRQSDGSWQLSYANAGHPPPLVRLPDARVVALDAGAGTLIGVEQTRTEPRPEGSVTLPAGSTLLLFTDGLIDRRDRPIDDGMAQLSAILGGDESSPQALCDRIAEEMADDEHGDDIALLAVTLH